MLRSCCLVLLFMHCAVVTRAQSETSPQLPGKGLVLMAPDSAFSVGLRFRIQNRAGFVFSEMADGSWALTTSEFRVRRLRLRLDGFVLNPKWAYAVQLSFSRADQDWDNSKVPNVLRDAMIFYRPNKRLTFAFGQGKLPGNRQRVVSSGEQQFADRSIVNATFNIDRDFGFHTTWIAWQRKASWILKAAISSGEGRNEGITSFASVNPGLCYTGRIEYLPFGMFDQKGDAFEADLAREHEPKLSIGGGYSYNEFSVRTGGQIGESLHKPISTFSFITDALFKYRGFSLYSEYIQRNTPGEAVSIDASGQLPPRYVFMGQGFLLQSGYLFKKNWEIAARYAQVEPRGSIRNFERERHNYSLCFSRYLRGHRMKIQSDITYETLQNSFSGLRTGRNFQWRFQIELGI